MMIVIGIAALVLSIGVPAVFQIVKKDPLRQALNDIIEACGRARAQAILHGAPAELRFQPKDRTFAVVMAGPPDRSNPSADPPGEADSLETQSVAANPQGYSGRLADDLTIEMLDVNFQEKKDEDEARVRFFPNGTSDEFTIVLQWPDHQLYRKITLDIITGQADVEVIR